VATERKKESISEIKRYLENNLNAVVTDYRGLNVAEISQLRRQLLELGITYKIAKNTLMRIVTGQLNLEDMNPYLVGPTAIAFNIEDPAQAAKLFQKFVKEHASLKIKAGLLDGRVISADQIKTLAALPGKEVLLSMLLGTMNAPVTAFARVINAPVQGLATVLQRIQESKAASEAA
jgi:large subunit ribosomal protein L10